MTFSTLFAMDEQLRREWKNAMQVAVGGLGTVILEKALVEMHVLEALQSSMIPGQRVLSVGYTGNGLYNGNLYSK